MTSVILKHLKLQIYLYIPWKPLVIDAPLCQPETRGCHVAFRELHGRCTVLWNITASRTGLVHVLKVVWKRWEPPPSDVYEDDEVLACAGASRQQSTTVLCKPLFPTLFWGTSGSYLETCHSGSVYTPGIGEHCKSGLACFQRGDCSTFTSQSAKSGECFSLWLSFWLGIHFTANHLACLFLGKNHSGF